MTITYAFKHYLVLTMYMALLGSEKLYVFSHSFTYGISRRCQEVSPTPSWAYRVPVEGETGDPAHALLTKPCPGSRHHTARPSQTLEPRLLAAQLDQ